MATLTVMEPDQRTLSGTALKCGTLIKTPGAALTEKLLFFFSAERAIFAKNKY